MSGVMFTFQEMIQEIDAIRVLAKHYIDKDSSQVLDALKRSLMAIQLKESGTPFRWEIPRSTPLRTKPSKGEYEAKKSGAKPFVVGELTSLWMITPLRDGKEQKALRFALGDVASTVVRVFDASVDAAKRSQTAGDGGEAPIAEWHMEFGDANSPGCYFHVQVPWKAANIPVPRLPTYAVSPLFAFEFVLGELFQTGWAQVAAAPSAPDEPMEKHPNPTPQRHPRLAEEDSRAPWEHFPLDPVEARTAGSGLAQRMNPRVPDSGTVYTPDALAAAMVRAVGDARSAAWLDPCVGEGAFVRAMSSMGVPKKRIVAIDLDPRPSPSDALAETVRGADFVSWSQGTPARFDRVVANPPYVALNRLDRPLLRAALSLRTTDDLSLRLKANYWCAFLVSALRLIAPNGSLCMVLPAAWDYADYAGALRARAPLRFRAFEVYRSREPLFGPVQDGCVVIVGRGFGASPTRTERFEFETTEALTSALCAAERRARASSAIVYLPGRGRVVEERATRPFSRRVRTAHWRGHWGCALFSPHGTGASAAWATHGLRTPVRHARWPPLRRRSDCRLLGSTSGRRRASVALSPARATARASGRCGVSRAPARARGLQSYALQGFNP